MRLAPCPGYLMARVISGAATEHEHACFRQHLDGCADCRVTEALSRSLLPDLEVGRDDADRLRAVAATVSARLESPRKAEADWAQEAPPHRAGRRSDEYRETRSGRQAWLRAWPRQTRSSPASRPMVRRILLIASVMILVTAAAAAALQVRRSRRPHEAVVRSAPHSTGHGRAGPDGLDVPTNDDASPAAPPLAVGTAATVEMPAREPPPAKRTGVGSQRTVERRRSVAEATPAALMAAAGRARRSGDIERASRFYRRLQRDFPQTAEAELSHVSLGKLLADAGDARGGLLELEAYLARLPEGPLAPEAWFEVGRLRALLGDAIGARGAWQTLVQRFSASPYARLARVRLQRERQ